MKKVIKKALNSADFSATELDLMDKWQAFATAFDTYVDGIEKTQHTDNVIPCGDDRLPIVEQAYEAFAALDSKLLPPEEVVLDDVKAQIVHYNVLKTLNDKMLNAVSNANNKKTYLGLCLADRIADLWHYLDYKVIRNEKYKDVYKIVCSYADPEDKRKQAANDKKKVERTEKQKGSTPPAPAKSDE